MATKILLNRGYFPIGDTSTHLDMGELGYNLDFSAQFPEVYGQVELDDNTFDSLVNPVVQLTDDRTASIEFLKDYTSETVEKVNDKWEFTSSFVDDNNGITSLNTPYYRVCLTPNNLFLRGDRLYCNAGISTIYDVKRATLYETDPEEDRVESDYYYHKSTLTIESVGVDYVYFEVPHVYSPTHFMMEINVDAYHVAINNNPVPIILFYRYNDTDMPRKVSIVNTGSSKAIALYCIPERPGINSNKVYRHTYTQSIGTVISYTDHDYYSVADGTNLPSIVNDSSAVSANIVANNGMVAVTEDYWDNNTTEGMGSIYLSCNSYPGNVANANS